MAVERCFSSGCAAELPLMRGVKVTWMRYGNAVSYTHLTLPTIAIV